LQWIKGHGPSGLQAVPGNGQLSGGGSLMETVAKTMDKRNTILLLAQYCVVRLRTPK
jgi:hypothetical protein